MNRFLASAARIGGLATLTMSLAACGPEDSVGRNMHFALAPTAPLLADAGYYPAVEALPLQPAATNYALAPSWDYAQSGFTDYTPADPYDYGGYYQPVSGGYYDTGANTETYAALALAALIAGVIGDFPPDYGFDYGGVQPWAWNTGDGYYRYAEPVSGGYRYYYYEPRAERPFLVRDPWYSYGYRDGRLSAIYDRDGRVLRQQAAVRQRLAAERYYARAWDLRRAAYADRHYGVSAPVWTQRRPVLVAEQRRWQQARAERVAWQRWDSRYESDFDNRWRAERTDREHAARLFDDWRREAYRGPAPRFYEARQREQAERLGLRREQAERLADQREQVQRQAQQQRAQVERVADRRDQVQQQRALAERVADRREQTQDRARQQQQVTARQQVDVRQQAAVRQQAVVERRQDQRREQATAQQRAAAQAQVRREAAARQDAGKQRQQAAAVRQQPQRTQAEQRQRQQAIPARQAAQQAAAQRDDAARQQARAAQQQAAARQQASRERAERQQADTRQQQAQAQRAQAEQARARQAEARRPQAVARRDEPAAPSARAETRQPRQQPAASRERPERAQQAERRESTPERRAERAGRGEGSR